MLIAIRTLFSILTKVMVKLSSNFYKSMRTTKKNCFWLTNLTRQKLPDHYLIKEWRKVILFWEWRTSEVWICRAKYFYRPKVKNKIWSKTKDKFSNWDLMNKPNLVSIKEKLNPSFTCNSKFSKFKMLRISKKTLIILPKL